jgi:hypothetical protein
LPWTIYAIGLIMKSYFLKWMLRFSDLKRIINVDIPWFHDDTNSPISHFKNSLIYVLAILISVLLAHSLVTLIV